MPERMLVVKASQNGAETIYMERHIDVEDDVDIVRVPINDIDGKATGLFSIDVVVKKVTAVVDVPTALATAVVKKSPKPSKKAPRVRKAPKSEAQGTPATAGTAGPARTPAGVETRSASTQGAGTRGAA